MRVLDKPRLDLITAIVAEAQFPGITAGLLEKDEHLTDALEAIFGHQFQHATLVFCGGTSLSKGHALIERMSEDADLKLILSEEASTWSQNQLRRYLGDEVRDKIDGALSALGFEQDLEMRASRNGNRYFHTQWAYQRAYEYGEASGLRPNLQIELTARAPLLPIEVLRLGSLADRLANRDGKSFDVPTVAVAETEAEKVLSFLRRYAQNQAGKMIRPWDTALVRHIYDVHCIHMQQPELIGQAIPVFSELVAGDQAELGQQHPEFLEDPIAVLEKALQSIGGEVSTREEYERNLLPLVYGNFKPGFDESFASFRSLATAMLASIR